MGTVGTAQNALDMKEITRPSGILLRWVSRYQKKAVRVNVPISLAGRRLRRYFASMGGALEWCEDFERRLAEHGRVATLADGMTFTQALPLFFELSDLQGRHESTARQVFEAFGQKLGSVPLHLIGPVELQKYWMRPEWSDGQREKVFRYLRMFFRWAEKNEVREGNPMAKVKKPRAAEPEKHFRTADEMLVWLSIDEPVWHAFCVLGALGGLRSSEILKAGNVVVREKDIWVRGGKTGPRYVKILPPFRRWWVSMPDAWPKVDAFYKRARKLIGGNLPQNALRDSFGTYHLAMWKSAEVTAHQMGNSGNVVKRSYADVVSEATARDWFRRLSG